MWPPLSKIDPRASESRARRRAPFEARFYADRLEKGSPDSAASYSYLDVFDVVEDARFPDVAVVRIADKFSEVVVRPSALSGEPWEDVKQRIRDAKGEVTLKEALFGKRGKS